MLEPRVDIYTAWIQDAKSNSNMIEKDHAKMTLQGSAKKSGIRALEFKRANKYTSNDSLIPPTN